MWNFLYLFVCLAMSILLFCILHTKPRIDSVENKLFKISMYANVISVLCELILQYFALHVGIDNLFTKILSRLYLVSIAFWFVVFSEYIFYIFKPGKDEENYDEKIASFQKRYKICTIIHTAILLVFFVFAMVLPIKFYINGNEMYSYGRAVEFLRLFLGSFMFSWILISIKNIKKIKNVKYIPILIIVLLLVLNMILQKINPSLLIVSFTLTFLSYIMYFTIENPDVKMIEQLEIAKEQADKANHAKSDFLSNMSHEIRTPLNAIVGFSETLKDEDIPDSARENVDDIIMASNNLLDIVNGILDISKIEANKLEIINKEYDIKSILDELIALTKARIGDKGLDFRVNIDPSLPRVLYGDNIRLKQVVLNILTNAVKYTKEGYVIFTVSSVIKDNVCRLIFSVEDSGIGIKEESIPKLFSKFERLDVEKEITIEGTGLGLAITKRLVELMNGTIVVQSVYGKGSKFTISIDQRIIAVEAPVIHEAPAAETKIVDAKGAKILVVDDNDLNLKVATVLLNKYHFTIDTATNGIECVNKVKRGGEYDIIFLDDMMPKMNGREALAKLKEDPNFNIPVIALTANAITGMRQEYLNCGFNDYLSKPIEKQELERVIKEYISKKRSSYANTDLSKSTNSILEKQFTIDLPVLAQNTSETPTNSDNSNKKVLVVDDNEMNLKIAVSNLKKYGFTIDSVSSGSDAIAKAIENHYDLVFLDEMMPELDGCKTLENLRDIDGFDAPTIMMTASPEDEVKDKIEEYKFNGYLAKPFKKEELDRVINDLLK